VSGPVRTVVWEDGRGNLPSYPITYAWTTYTAFQTQKTGQSRSVSWELLHEQMGGEYASIKDFGHKARLALRKV
jgi:hypothetical protein